MSSSATPSPREDVGTILTDAAPTIGLQLTGIGKSFPGVRALDDVSLSVRCGEIHGVVGENGAGKSTLMSVASGSLVPDQGTVLIGGQSLDPTAGPERSRELGLAIVRQEPALLPDLTVAENLYLGVPAHCRPAPTAIATWAQTVLRAWGESMDIEPGTRVASLVPRQRFVVEICRALAQKPTVLVLDEPSEHLVGDDVETLFSHVRALATAGTAVVYISHRIHEVKALSDRITVLRSGRTQGTHEATTLSEDDIVALIIGRELDALFPPKASADALGPIGLSLDKFTTAHVAPVTLEARAGEIIGLAGIEGNGQRDFLRALGGLQKHQGSVTVAGRAVRGSTRRAGIAYVSGDRHNEGVLTGLSVGENISLRMLPQLRRAGVVSHRAERSFVSRIIDEYAVKTPSPQTPIESLSGGNQQKALLGGTLASTPRVLLIDEPTQGVDIGAKNEIYRVLRAAADAGAVVVVLSSDSLELAGLADRVLVFSRGHIVTELSGETVSEEQVTAAALKASTTREHKGTASSGVMRWLATDSAPPTLVGAGVIALTAAATIANAVFLGPKNIAFVLTLAAVVAVVAVGQLLTLITGGIDLSVGPLMGFSAILASFYLVDGTSLPLQALGWGLLLAVPLLVGLINWLLVDVVRLYPMIATLVTYMALQGLSLVLRPVPDGLISDRVLAPFNARIGPVPLTFLAAVVITLMVGYALAKTAWGIRLRAVGSAPDRAALNGIDPRALRLTAYLGCSFLAGLAGILLMSQIGSGDATAGVTYTLTSITAAVVGGASVFGGRGTAIGALLGAVLIQVLNSVTTFLHLGADWPYYLLGGMTIGAVVLYSRSRLSAAAS
ncbi:ATP-binding cassette domain-containing protein [Rhodococcus zopfii]|uniref:ATP-binding cassette domain-containing protein n=1 Tax=Rhodococcus zopfii TaxID=43772 RepID=UPI00111124E0|nr:ATP-binding cassette domain-containing protein [Rhodococcus zopfii]